MRRSRTALFALALALAACGNSEVRAVEAAAEEDVTSSTMIDAPTSTAVSPSTAAPMADAPTTTTPEDASPSASGDVVLAVRQDGTALVAAETIVDDSSPCGEYTMLASVDDERVTTLGQIDGSISSARSTDGMNVRITVRCSGELLTSTAAWAAGSIDISGLENTDGWPTFPLAGTSGVSVRLEELERTETCEIDTRLGRILGRDANGTESPWTFPSGESTTSDWIDEFISTPDGRFALIESFTCSHEGPVKSVAAGTYDPTSGDLLSLQGVLLPSDFTTERSGWQINHPDALSIDQDGQIVAWLGTEDGGLMSVAVG